MLRRVLTLVLNKQTPAGVSPGSSGLGAPGSPAVLPASPPNKFAQAELAKPSCAKARFAKANFAKANFAKAKARLAKAEFAKAKSLPNLNILKLRLADAIITKATLAISTFTNRNLLKLTMQIRIAPKMIYCQRLILVS